MDDFKFETTENNSKNMVETLAFLNSSTKHLIDPKEEIVKESKPELLQQLVQEVTNNELSQTLIPVNTETGTSVLQNVLKPVETQVVTKDKLSNSLAEIHEVIDKYEMFLDHMGQAYATKNSNGVKKTYCIDDDIADVLQHDYIVLLNDIPSDSLIKKTIKLMKYYASENNQPRKTYKRFAYVDGCIYHDLNDGRGHIVKINEYGWEVLVNPPIEFIRSGNMESLPMPCLEGNYELFFNFLNIKKQDDLNLLKVFIPCVFNSEIARPALFMVGVKGSSKTSAARFIRRIIDPVVNDCMFPGKSERDMNLIFSKHPFPVFDNAENYDTRQSNLFCGAITGTGMEERKLHTNSQTVFTSYKRSFISTSISMPTIGSDLVDRAIVIELDKIREENRKPEEVLFAKFANELPSILGGLYSVLSQTLKNKNSLVVRSLPRMADFAMMACAVGLSIGINSDEVLRIYNMNKLNFYSNKDEDDKFYLHLVEFLEVKNGFTGNVTDCLNAFKLFVDGYYSIDSDCVPKAANAFSKKLKRYDEHLTLLGWDMQFSEHAKQTRNIVFKKIVI